MLLPKKKGNSIWKCFTLTTFMITWGGKKSRRNSAMHTPSKAVSWECILNHSINFSTKASELDKKKQRNYLFKIRCWWKVEQFGKWLFFWASADITFLHNTRSNLQSDAEKKFFPTHHILFLPFRNKNYIFLVNKKINQITIIDALILYVSVSLHKQKDVNNKIIIRKKKNNHKDTFLQEIFSNQNNYEKQLQKKRVKSTFLSLLL